MGKFWIEAEGELDSRRKTQESTPYRFSMKMLGEFSCVEILAIGATAAAVAYVALGSSVGVGIGVTATKCIQGLAALIPETAGAGVVAKVAGAGTTLASAAWSHLLRR